MSSSAAPCSPIAPAIHRQDVSAEPLAGRREPDAGDVDYRALLGDAAWHRLPRAVRARFHCHGAAEVMYVGSMGRVALSRVGRILAAACRLVGEPLVAGEGLGVPAHVRVFRDARGGTVWERAYRFPGRATRTVRSAKRLDRDASLLECLGFGMHMRLAVREVCGELHFLSTGYFWKVLGLRVPLPRRWFPGETRVVHQDLGGGRFRFLLTIHHPLFGELVHQDGVFIEQEEPS